MTSAINVQNLSFAYGAKPALDHVSFDVPAGQFCALLGPNGAGKSTLFSLLTGLLSTTTGHIEIAGQSMQSNRRAALAKMGVVFQQPTLDLDVSVQANMLYFAALQGLPKRIALPRIQDALNRLDMYQRRSERVRRLNGGHRRRMEIARALIHRPDVLLLDEPTVGLDAATRQGITDHVHSLADDGMAVLWATHLVDEIQGSDKIVLLHHSKVRAHGLCNELCQSQTLDQWFQDQTGAE